MAKDLSRKVSIYINGKQIENTLDALNAELKKLKKTQQQATIGSEEYITTSMKMKELRSVINEQTKAIDLNGKAWQSSSENIAKYSHLLMGMQAAGQMGQSAMDWMADFVGQAASLDDAYADVMKTTGLTHDAVLELQEDFKKMDTRTSREQLNELAYEAGKLGISAKDDVLGFVKAADKINIALGDELGEGAITSIGKMSDLFAKTSQQFSGKDLEGRMLSIGSAINSLGAASTANEEFLVEFLSRMGGVAVQAGMSADQVLAFGSALDQLGLPAEMSSSALSKLITSMISKTGMYAKVAGMQVSDFSNLLKTDMYGAIRKVLEGFNSAGGMANMVPVLEDLKVEGVRTDQVYAGLAKSLDKVSAAQKIANDQLISANSIEDEANTKNSSLQARLEISRKAVVDAKEAIGQSLLPAFVALNGVVNAGMSVFSGFINVLTSNKVVLVSLVTGLLALNAARIKNTALTIAANIQKKILLAQQKIEEAQVTRLMAAEAREVAVKSAAAAADARRQATLAMEVAEQNNATAGSAMYVASINAQIRAKELESAAERANAAAVEASSIARKSAMPILAAITVAVTAVIAVISSLSRKENEQSQALKEAKQSINGVVSEYLVMKNAYNQLGQNFSAKQKYIDDNAAAFERLGVKIRNTNEADQYFSKKGTEDYINAVTQRALADKYAASMAEKTIELTQLKNKISEIKKPKNLKETTINPMTGMASYSTTSNVQIQGDVSFLEKKKSKIVSDIKDMENEWKSATDAANKYFSVTGASEKKTSFPSASGSAIDTGVESSAEKKAARAAKAAEKQKEKDLNTYDDDLAKAAAAARKMQDLMQDAKEKLAGKDEKDDWTAIFDEQMEAVTAAEENINAEIAKVQDIINDPKTPQDLKKRLQTQVTAMQKAKTEFVRQATSEAEKATNDQILQKAQEAEEEQNEREKEAAKQAAEDKIQIEKEALQRRIDLIQDYSEKVTSIMSSITDIMKNENQKQIDDYEEARDKELSALEDSYNSGAISQEEYTDKKTEVENEYADKIKELELEQWRREKAMSISEAVINGALAVVKTFGEAGWPAGIPLAALMAAATAAQIAAIATEPEPYAKGGYITGRQYAVMGEQGSEWVASNRLLSNPVTSALIASLDDYQRGRTAKFLPATPDFSATSQAAAGIAAAQGRGESGEMLSLIRQLTGYLEDPANRRAVISRRHMLDFEENENFLRDAARL